MKLWWLALNSAEIQVVLPGKLAVHTGASCFWVMGIGELIVICFFSESLSVRV